ncbi:MAG: 2-amino-4-hydroxy-6-hydroxymethyldihydropteridine diphosphokinase, partial [Streptococcaceae bacterium]|nr:2-amino-4-hydroxy-6-hydroxymethyldihydropteridine diphosphokinase [Streptococcaceae bacterium]
MNQVFLSLGSNLGNRWAYLKQAISLLQSNEKIELELVSPIYQTSPVAQIKQPDFLNLALKIKTSYRPLELLEYIHLVENKLDRKRTVRWGARTVDIDILYFNEVTFLSKDLEIPHRELGNRLFVLVPLLAICGLNFYQLDYLHKQVLKLENSGQK